MNDWQRIVADLRQRMLLRDIGEAVGLNPATIGALGRGQYAQPNWEAGQALLALHRRKVRGKRGG